jgi:hypothetical protein
MQYHISCFICNMVIKATSENYIHAKNGIKFLLLTSDVMNLINSKLKDTLRQLVQLCFIKKNDQCRYKYLVLGKDISYFVKKKPL